MRLALKTLMAVALLCAVQAATYAVPAHFTRLPSNNVSNSINALARDSEGFVWIGTSAGLLRYDGYSYRDFREYDNLPVAHDRIRCISPDPGGRLWIGTESGALVYDPGSVSFKMIGGPTAGNPVKAVARTCRGDYLLAGVDGVDIVDGVTMESHYLPADTLHPYLKNCRRLATDQSGNIWTGYQDQLVKLDFSSSRFEPEVLIWDTPGQIRVFTIGRDNKLYYLAGADMLCVSPLPVDGRGLDPVSLLSRVDVREVIAGEDGTLTVATSYDGIYRIGSSSEQFWINKEDHTDITNAVLCAMQDAGGNLYYGTANGLFAEWNTVSSFFRSIHGGGEGNLLHNVITDLHTADGRTIWAASNTGLDEIEYDGMQCRITHHPIPGTLASNSSNTRIQCICPDGKGVIWIGTKGGVALFDTASRAFSRVPGLSERLSSQGASFCKCMLIDSAGLLWMGFINGGLYVYHPSNGKCIPVSLKGKDMGDISVNSLLQDRSGTVWVSTNGKGLFAFDAEDLSAEGRVYRYRSFFEDSGTIVYNLCQLSGGSILACTSQGLYSVPPEEDDAPVRLSEGKGPYNHIIEDAGGGLWLSSATGLQYLNPDYSGSRYFELYESAFSRMDYNTGACLSFDGKVFYGGINGITWFSPDEVMSVPERVRPHVSSATVMGSSVTVPADGRIRLKYNDYHLSLTLSTLSFPVDPSQSFYYRVRESGDAWIPMESNVLSFANLSPGEYHISFTCVPDSSGRDSMQEVILDVSNPWWKTWWAYSIYTLLAGCIVFWIAWFFISKDRTESQMRTVLNVAHGLRTPLSLMKVPVQMLKSGSGDGALLDMVDRNADMLGNSINQLLELDKIDRKRPYMHPCNIDLKDFLQKIIACFEPLFASKGLSLAGVFPETPCPYTCDPDKIELVFFNLLTNAFSFTREGGATVTLTASPETIGISVCDTGIGIDRKYFEKIYERFWQYRQDGTLPPGGSGIGLSVVKEFVRMHGGRITLESAPGAGADFRISLPRRKFRSSRNSEVQKVDPDYTRRYAGSIRASVEEPVPPDGGKTAVVVSGEADMVNLLRKVLPGFAISASDNLGDAMQRIHGSHPQIVLINLDDKNREESLEFCRSLKSDYTTSDIPVVYITNEDSPGEARLYYEIGADSHISKPFDPDLLRARIDQLVNKHLNIRERIKVEKILSSGKDLEIESADEKFLRDVMDVVESVIPDESFKLEEFSARMHCSKSVLSSRVRSITGRSPMDLMRNARMLRAAQLLSSGAYDVTQVCYMVGFSDPRYFATCFKKQYSCTPTAYIRQNKSNQP